jgi:hypothetical protein
MANDQAIVEDHTKRNEINLLFDAMSHEKGMREHEIIAGFYAKQAAAALSEFLKDVTTCPPAIIEYCQELLAPKPVE